MKEKALADGTETKTVTFTYDPFGRRIEKAVEKKSYDVVTQQYVTKKENYRYVYDNEDIVLELYANPADAEPEKTYFTHGPGIDEHLALERNGEFHYYHADGLGSVVAITNGASNVVQSYGYDSFGMATQTTPAPVRNSYTYAGREWDKVTGTILMGNRYYDPVEGRFISKDPIGFAGEDVNLYQYVQANPINWVDPSGLAQAIPMWGGLPFYIPPGSVFDRGSHDNKVFVGSVIQLLELFDPRPLMDWVINKADSKADSEGKCEDRKKNVDRSKSPVWDRLKPFKGKTKTNGDSGKKRRYFEWDNTHNDIEAYDSRGRHLGTIDPESGNFIKPPVPGRTIDL